MLDQVIFGDNQFFGINHMSESKAAEQAERFRDVSSIIDVVDTAYQAGIRGFMFNTHERVQKVCDHFRANIHSYSGLQLYPSMPYAHKYANAVADKGIFGAIREVVVADSSASEVLQLFAKGGASVFDKDLVKLMQILVDMEMKMFNGLPVKAIFLQNIVTDLLLGFGVKDPFLAFVDYIREKYDAVPGFVTLNLPKATDFLDSCGIRDVVICSTINAIGFNMNPDIAAYEKALERDDFHFMAMSVLASGAVPPEQAIEYISSLKNVESVVFGASSKKNIVQTRELIESKLSSRK